ncbi:MAG: glycosyltransferase family 2 protein [Candidatus Jordarchaeum sp.]|uniref:glycosyltransferase family 2 protein n=1 Tax=Candidatus Jordarchaeum sp. TaxID=2823881 RepID=UPI0040491D72
MLKFENTTETHPTKTTPSIIDAEKTEIDISVVIPCLNEEPTIGECINKIKNVFRKLKLRGEIIVSDSSTDNSPTIAKKLGAKVVHPPEKGYGTAYLTGISEAKGQYIVMADADGTYNLEEIYKFIKILQKDGADIVIGTRLKGKILHGSMPRLHRYIGNPLLTLTANILFGTRISDMHCGMRAITKKAWKKIKTVSPGMEFASEMLIKAAKKGLKIVETPITYHPRKGTNSKLNPLKDGYRHLKLLIKSRFTKSFSK